MMAKIHWIAYILVGALVSLVSWKIDFNDLMIFFYAGIAFIVIGFFKIFIGLARRNEEKKSENLANQGHRRAGQQNSIHPHQTQRRHIQHRQPHNSHRASEVVPHAPLRTHNRQMPAQQYKRCKNCGNPARIRDNFCSNCGYNM